LVPHAFKLPEVQLATTRVDGRQVSLDRLDEFLNKHHVLGIFGLPDLPKTPLQVPQAQITFEAHDDHPGAEVWTSDHPVSHLQFGRLTLAHDGDTLMGSVSFDADGETLEQETNTLYRQILDCCEELGFAFLYRIWNYMPDINGFCPSGLERYRAFCLGRARAFFEERDRVEAFLPAGTGIGSHGDQVSIIFMAARRECRINMENPRQVPAYHYPTTYGPRSPSFSRGTLVRRADADEIFVSGTSSIIGHKTVHAGDIEKQCQITFKNIDTLLSRENLTRYGIKGGSGSGEMDLVKVFIRRQQDWPIVQAICSQHLNPGAQVMYLGADICRSDLLVEVEGRVRLEHA